MGRWVPLTELFEETYFLLDSFLHELYVASAGDLAPVDFHLVELVHFALDDVDLPPQGIRVVLDKVFLLGKKVLVHLGQHLLLELGVIVAHHHASHVLPVLGHLVLHLGRGLLVVLVALLGVLLRMLLLIEEIIFLGLIVLLIVRLVVVLLGWLLLILIGWGWGLVVVIASALVIRIEVDAVITVHADVGVVVGHVLGIAHIGGRLGLQSVVTCPILPAVVVLVVPASVVG